MKREALYALAQGTCTPTALDSLWELRLGAFKGPFKMSVYLIKSGMRQLSLLRILTGWMTLAWIRCSTSVRTLVPFRDLMYILIHGFVERHYAEERGNLPEEPRKLLEDYISKGWLGKKSGRGFYDYSAGDGNPQPV